MNPPSIDDVLRRRSAGGLGTAAEQAAAAAVLLASADPALVQLAHDLALQAMAREPAARVLAATAFDRLRRLRGEPQKFGTQPAADGKGELWPVDEHTTDSERAKWGLPPLAELRRRAAGGRP